MCKASAVPSLLQKACAFAKDGLAPKSPYSLHQCPFRATCLHMLYALHFQSQFCLQDAIGNLVFLQSVNVAYIRLHNALLKTS